MHRTTWLGMVFSVAGAALLGVVTIGAPAHSQEYGDAGRGSTLAVRVCVACHGVRKGEDSTNPLAPSFTVIAETRGMSPMALNVALLSPHQAMPNIMLDAQERADIVAYILTQRPN